MPLFPSHNRRGAALLLVLGAIILLSVIVIGFLMTVRQDRASSDYYQTGASARQYADTAVNIAIAQIADATSDPNLTWISQPGLLRTFDTNGPVAAYKLYSSKVMKVNGAYDPESSLANEVPNDWYSRTDAVNQYVDLNRPVTVTESGSTRTMYPIADPDAVSDVEGFSIDTSSSSLKPAPSSAAYNLLPMPVSWIYVLKDGKLVDYDTARASSDVVARVAFWGDDETCKVNINTASDGPYYDSPVAHTKQDHELGRFQPIAQEYQRYPGHPATTSLASVFKELRSDTSPSSRSFKASKITPRIGWGGSQGATERAWFTRNLGVLDFDRLYTSIDELTFGRDASGAWTTSGATPDRTMASLTLDLGKLPFFLTTESRAPELNLFNRPRITLWPFNKELIATDSPTNQTLTPEDRLIRFASEIGSNKRKLYFQRENAWDPKNDWDNIADNQDIYHYLQWLTQKPFPGASSRTGGASANFQNKFSARGRDQILTEMFDYLRSQVNVMNRSYEPVGGPVYSFPQEHDLNNIGFNDRSPLIFDAGNGETKGLGSGGIVMNEFIMQFYDASEFDDGFGNNTDKMVDLINNSTGADGADTKMDYIIRRVQMVVLMDFVMSINTLTSAMPRFQAKLEGMHLFLNPNPDGVPTDPAKRVYVRYFNPTGQADDANWSTNAIDLMMPDGAVNVYCSNDAQFDSYILGGSLGLSYGLSCETNGKAYSGFLTDSGVKKTLNSNATKDYKSYPFVSAMLEFRIPLKRDSSGNPVKDAITQKPAADPDPTIVGLEGVPTASGPLNGTGVTITTYPALQKATQTQLKANNSLSTLLAPTTSSNYLQKIDLVIANCKLPLPKMGPDTTFVGIYNQSFSPKYKYSQLSNYSRRLDYRSTCPSDMMILVPNGPEGGTAWVPSGTSTRALMDSFRSYTLSVTQGSKGDYRVAAARRDIPSNWYEPNPAYLSHPEIYQGMSYLSSFAYRYGGPEIIRISPTLESTSVWGGLNVQISRLVANGVYGDTFPQNRMAPNALVGAKKANSTDGDYTNSYGSGGDGGLVKGPDVGANTNDGGSDSDPYFAGSISRSGSKDSLSEIDSYHANYTGLVYSPWKQMPSAVRFGTLASRAVDGDPFETLLFNPVPAGGKSNHRGWTNFPRDHYWLDLFYMPVVEPYAITENFATNGKINLNQQIAPFTYIRRNTGLWALLRNMKVLAIPAADTAAYKSVTLTYSNAKTTEYRKPLVKSDGTTTDLSNTVALIQDRLKVSNDPFISASEICEIPMLIEGQSAATIENYWNDKQTTGDDSREAPYNAIYPRVTTRSNTYRIHFIAQTLKGKPGQWNVAGQYRGSQIVERYLDGFSGAAATRIYGTGSQPSTQFPALAGNDANGVPFYRFRKLSHQQFSP